MMRLAAVLLASISTVTPSSCPGQCGTRAGETVGAAVAPLQHRRVFRYWSRQPIADCSWVGESSAPGDYAGRFALWRYRVSNASGSGAYGKFQMMPGTYAAFARFGDWSRADQEYAAHRLFRAQGTGPWSAC